MKEQALQAQCVQHFQQAGYYPLAIFHPLQNARNAIHAQQLKAVGFKAGIPDLCILLTDGRVLWLELKTEKGQRSAQQKTLHQAWEAFGHSVHLIRSLKDFKAILLQFSKFIPKFAAC